MAHQRLVLVPGLYGNDSASPAAQAVQDERLLAKLEEYWSWAREDETVVGLNPVRARRGAGSGAALSAPHRESCSALWRVASGTQRAHQRARLGQYHWGDEGACPADAYPAPNNSHCAGICYGGRDGYKTGEGRPPPVCGRLGARRAAGGWRRCCCVRAAALAAAAHTSQPMNASQFMLATLARNPE